MQTVQLLKLVSGEELLGRVSCDDNAVYTITMPVTIVQDESNMGFEPFMPYSDSDSFEISGDKVILAANPTVSLKDYYINATTFAPAETESVIDLSATSGIVV
jgi:hypothetical protein